MKTYFFGELANLGLDASFFDTNPSEQQIAQALQGRRFTATVFHETGNDGKVRAKIVSGSIQPPVGSAPAAGPGVPSGLPAAPVAASTGVPAPVAQPAPAAAPQAAPAAPENPWGPPAGATAPAPAANQIPLPPQFGG
jgi:hypothetical protein